MTDLPGLPAFGPEPVFAANDAAYARVVRRAVARRRRHGAAAASASLAAVVTLVLVANAGGAAPHSLEPAQPPPAGPGHEHWTERVDTVIDGAPGEGCVNRAPRDGWCFRYTGPASARSGEAVAFTAELCRVPGGTSASRVDLRKEVELGVWLSGPDKNATGETIATADAGRNAVDRPHARTVAAGRCLRWTATWNGVGARGTARPATYDLAVAVNGTAPRQPLPGSSTPAPASWFTYSVDFAIS